MKKILVVLFTILILVGCQLTNQTKVPEREADVVGLIYQLESDNNSILVVSGIEDIDIPYDEWFEEGKYAVVFRIEKDTIIINGKDKLDFSLLKEGQRVKVWHTGVLAESYPMQGEAVYVEVLN